MHRGFQILALGLVLAAMAYAISYLAGTAETRQLLHSPQPELAWLKKAYQLSDADFARISQLHNAYLPKCAAHCRRIDELNQNLERALSEASTVTPEIKTLLAERAEERADCQAEMLDHFFQVSRTMPPEQGRRYLDWVQRHTALQEPAMVDHAEPSGLKHH